MKFRSDRREFIRKASLMAGATGMAGPSAWTSSAWAHSAVKQNGNALEYVKTQTPELCLEAVKQNGLALRYVKEQTPELCLEAVKQYGYALQYVKEQTFKICMEAVKQDSNVQKYVKI